MPIETGLRSAADSVPLDWNAVREYLATKGHRLDLDPPPRQFAGGLANLNYLIHLDGKPGGAAPPANGGTASRRLRHGARVPHPVAAADALPFVAARPASVRRPSVIGQRVPDHRIPAGSGDPRAHARRNWRSGPDIGARLSQVLLETMAAIHAVDTAAVGLDDLGRPEGFLARAVAGWRKRGLAAMEDGTDALHQRHRQLAGTATSCRTARPALLHNDFKLNNMILDPHDFSPVAVVDWDQGTRGDPLFDFATLLTYWIHADDPRPMHDMEQMPADEACLCSAPAGGGGLCRAVRPGRVGLPVPPRARDVQAVGDLPPTRPALPQRRDARSLATPR